MAIGKSINDPSHPKYDEHVKERTIEDTVEVEDAVKPEKQPDSEQPKKEVK